MTTHIFNMLGVIFCEQHSMATEVEFLEMPVSLRADNHTDTRPINEIFHRHFLPL